MKIKFIAFFLLLSSGSAFAVEFPIEISEYIDDVKVDAYVSASDISAESKWQPFQADLPLSINDALKAVSQYLSANPELTNSTLIGIELKPIPHHDDYWHYLVKLKSHNDSKRKFNFLVVLMDGKVISAFQEPESIK